MFPSHFLRSVSAMTCSIRGVAFVASLAATGVGAPGAAIAADTFRFQAPASDLSAALSTIALQSNRQIFFLTADTAGKRGGPVVGVLTLEAALTRALRGSGLTYSLVGDRGILIASAHPAPSKARPPAPPVERPAEPTTVASVAVRGSAPPRPDIERIDVGQLADYGATSLEALGQADPTVIVSPTGPGQVRLALRGAYGAGEASVPVVFDGIPVSGPAGASSDASAITADLGLIDIARMEILKGPQGTDRGAAGMSGELDIATARPVLGAYEASAAIWGLAATGGGAGWTSEAVINAPVGERAALRLVVYDQERPGYVDNVLLGKKDVNHQATRGLRLSARVALSDRLEVSALALLQKRRIDDAAAWNGALGAYRIDRALLAPNEQQLGLYSLRVAFDGAQAKLASHTSYYDWRMDRRFDFTPVLLSQADDADGCRRLFDLAAPQACTTNQASTFRNYVLARTPAFLHQPTSIRAIIQEFTVANDDDAPLHYAGGLYYEQRWERSTSGIEIADPATGLARSPLAYVGLRQLRSDFRQGALFGELSWRQGAWKTIAGARSSAVSRSGSSAVLAPNLISGSLTSIPDRDVDDVGLSFRLREEVSAFNATFHAQVSQGWRPGGVNTAPVLPSDEGAFAPDSSLNFELGYRGTALGGRARLGLIAYRTDWRDMQYRAITQNGSFGYVTNIGSATINGLEAEADVKLAPGLLLGLQGVYTDARLRGDEGNRQAVGGARADDLLPNVPRLRLLASLRYDWRIADGWDGSIGLRTLHRSMATSEFRPENPNFLRAPSSDTTDLTFSVKSAAWMASFQVQNLFDKVVVERVVSSAYGPWQVFSSPPRTVSVGLRRSW